MDEIRQKMKEIILGYEPWFIKKVNELGLPKWTSLQGNLYWIRYTYNFATDLSELIQKKFGNKKIKILDFGAGKGFLSFLLAASKNIDMHAVDVEKNPYFSDYLRDFSSLFLNYRLFDKKLPFPEKYFDVILLIEVLEHAESPKEVIDELCRVLKRGGFAVITTPPRLKFLFRKDPHFRIRFFYLLPLFLQNFIIERVLKYSSVRGYGEYKMHKIFWNIFQIKKLFPKVGYKIEAFPPNSIFSWRRVIIQKE